MSYIAAYPNPLRYDSEWLSSLQTKDGNRETEQTKIMSWSISFIGKPEKVAEALEANSSELSGYSKVEYDKALPHMVALVKENFGNEGELVKCVASGHGYIVNDVPQQGHLNCEITSIYGVMV